MCAKLRSENVVDHSSLGLHMDGRPFDFFAKISDCPL